MKKTPEYFKEIKEGIEHNAYDGHYLGIIDKIKLESYNQGVSDSLDIVNKHGSERWDKPDDILVEIKEKLLNKTPENL